MIATFATFRTAVGAGTSSFSGVYNDLSSKPTLFDGAYGSLSGTSAGLFSFTAESEI